ncbi:MAG: histidine phosphatase family protein [bacterium]
MLLYLLRHGETEWNVERRIQGVTGVSLNEVGRAQARALAASMEGLPVRALYASPLLRSRETAEAVAAALGLPVREEPRLKELDQGDLEGLKIEEIQERHNGFLESWKERPAGLRMPGGETLDELQERAWGAMEDFRENHPEETVAAVSHNLTITVIMCRVLGVDLNSFRGIRQHNASLNIIEHTPQRGWSVVTMNSLAHLRGDPGLVRNLSI